MASGIPVGPRARGVGDCRRLTNVAEGRANIEGRWVPIDMSTGFHRYQFTREGYRRAGSLGGLTDAQCRPLRLPQLSNSPRST